MKTQRRYSPKYVIELSRQHRLNLTAAESLLWSKLNRRQLDGFRFRCQHPIGRYIVDFYCHEKRLAIELDGEIHNGQKRYDTNRECYLRSFGCTVIRFDNTMVMTDIDSVLNDVKRVLHNNSHSIPHK